MTKILTHAWMIVISDMVKYVVSVLAITLVERTRTDLITLQSDKTKY